MGGMAVVGTADTAQQNEGAVWLGSSVAVGGGKVAQSSLWHLVGRGPCGTAGQPAEAFAQVWGLQQGRAGPVLGQSGLARGRSDKEWERGGHMGGGGQGTSQCDCPAPALSQEATPLSLKQRQQWIFLEKLVPDTPYELQVRARVQRGQHSTWSPWSQALAFRTRPAGTAAQGGVCVCRLLLPSPIPYTRQQHRATGGSQPGLLGSRYSSSVTCGVLLAVLRASEGQSLG